MTKEKGYVIQRKGDEAFYCKEPVAWTKDIKLVWIYICKEAAELVLLTFGKEKNYQILELEITFNLK